MLSKKGRTKWEFKTNKRKVHRFWFPGNLRLSESDIASGKNVFLFSMFRRTLTARLEPSAPPTPPPPETPQRWTQLPDQQRWLFKLTQSTNLVFNWNLAFVNNISPPEHLQVRTSVTDDQPSTLHSRHQTTKLPQIPNTIAWRSPGSHLKVTWRSPDGHLLLVIACDEPLCAVKFRLEAVCDTPILQRPDLWQSPWIEKCARALSWLIFRIDRLMLRNITDRYSLVPNHPTHSTVKIDLIIPKRSKIPIKRRRREQSQSAGEEQWELWS